MAIESDIIAARRNQIAAERAKHEEALNALAAEDQELEIAQRVLSRLMASPPSRSAVAVAALEAAVGTRKPPNIPTIPEMIAEVLKPTNALMGAPAMTPKHLAEEIRIRWWPTVTPTEISPIAWRMAKRGELVKEGPLYKWPTPDASGVVKVTPPDGDEPPDSEAE